MMIHILYTSLQCVHLLNSSLIVGEMEELIGSTLSIDGSPKDVNSPSNFLFLNIFK